MIVLRAAFSCFFLVSCVPNLRLAACEVYCAYRSISAMRNVL